MQTLHSDERLHDNLEVFSMARSIVGMLEGTGYGVGGELSGIMRGRPFPGCHSRDRVARRAMDSGRKSE